MFDLDMDLKEALTQIERDLASVEEEKARLLAREEQLRVEKKGIESFYTRVNGREAVKTWGDMSRTDAVIRVLAEANGRGYGPAEISRILAGNGRTNDKPAYVSAALAYLKNKNRVESQGEGKWVLRSSKPPGLTGVPMFGGGGDEQPVGPLPSKAAASGGTTVTVPE